MRIIYAACFSLLIAGSVMPPSLHAAPSQAASPGDHATSPAAPPAAPLAKKPQDHEASPEGTPAVVVDDSKMESLLGKVVTSETGEKFGPITDILVGHTGAVRAAVIDFGGFLGVGTRKIAVAWSALHFSTDSIVLNMTRDELRVTPEYRGGEPVVIVGQPPAQPAAPANTPHPPSH
jgi:hypothetical protein